MKKKLVVMLSVLACLSLTACSTTLGENTSIFFREVNETVSVWLPSSETTVTSSGSTKSGEALPAVTEFVVDDDGSFSFVGNDQAAYYVITVCDLDVTEDGDTFLYSSSRLELDGSDTYSGNLFDMFTIPYGGYLIKCFAYPEIGDDTYVKSTAVTEELLVYGNLETPEIDYFWDIFEGTLTLQLGNSSAYSLTCLPDSIEITITGEDGSSQVLVLDDVENVTEITTADVSEGTYSITAVAYSTNEYVYNQVTDEVVIAAALELGIDNLISDGYSYTNTGLGHGYSWPVGTKTFNPTEASSLGAFNGTDFYTEVAESTLGTTSKSVYSFTFTMAVGFGESGWMELYSDGTCAAHNDTSGPVSASSVEGTWYWNEDGETITINWNMGSVVVSV